MENKEADITKEQDEYEALQRDLGFKTPLSNIMHPASNISDRKCEPIKKESMDNQKDIDQMKKLSKMLSGANEQKLHDYLKGNTVTFDEVKQASEEIKWHGNATDKFSDELKSHLKERNELLMGKWTQPRRLMLGAGKHIAKQEGDVFLDIRPFDNIDIVHDLNVTPWPFDDEKFLHINASHVIEHLDSLITFMDECHRILKPGGTLYCITPHAGMNTELEWADPTHKRLYTTYSIINYFMPMGVVEFGYTKNAWAVLKIEKHEAGEKKDCLEFLVTPIKNYNGNLEELQRDDAGK